jgi:hypothetical protein
MEREGLKASCELAYSIKMALRKWFVKVELNLTG